ncbi:MAG: hypothetical protein CMK09_17290 [Ponticaulis sp.]|nr:hypothetical protein [Ponticaulis sp.]|tara:strand:- start:27497 stop:28249 length:753 start_codon:yes stop_codon:yes gene_type:complete
MARIVVAGTCCTRDPLQESGHEIVAFSTLVVWTALASPPIKFEDRYLEGTDHSSFIQRSIREQFEKTWFDRITSFDFDWLILDLLSERRALIEVGDSFLFENWTLQKSPVINDMLKDYPRVTKRGPLPVDRWLELTTPAIDRFREVVDPSRVIVNRVVPGPGYREPDGSIRPHPPGMREEFDYNAEHLPAIYDAFCARLPGCHQIRTPRDLMVSDPDHRWGRGPFHYEAAFEDYVRSQINEIIARHTLPA